jgi:branched-chain amino acid transport system permease protein
MLINDVLGILISGSISGICYGLLALGLTLIYGVARIVNLAHGSLYMLGAFAYYVFSTVILGLDPWIALAMTAILMAIIGAFLYRIMIHPILGDDVALLVATITLAVFSHNLAWVLFGSQPVYSRIPIQVVWIDLPGTSVSTLQILSVCLSLSLFIVLASFINKYKIGKAMKAVSQDREASMLMGINVDRVIALTLSLSSMAAAIAGFSGAIIAFGETTFYMWTQPLTTAFAIVILGGLGSIKGSMLGGLIIGFAEKATNVYVAYLIGGIAGSITNLVSLLIIIIILLIRPKGLFGKVVEMEE